MAEYVIEKCKGAELAYGAYSRHDERPQPLDATRDYWLLWRKLDDGTLDDGMDGIICHSAAEAVAERDRLLQIDAEDGEDG